MQQRMWRRPKFLRSRRKPADFDGILPPHLRGKSNRGRHKKPDLDDGGVPVDPNRPSHLSGGAAAALEFDADS